jgi:hypothetical protein
MRPYHFRRPRLIGLAALALAPAAASCARSPAAAPIAPDITIDSAPAQLATARPDTGAFLITLGNDTIGIERYIRAANGFTVERVSRVGRTTVQQYSMAFAPTGSLSTVEVRVFPPGDNTSVTPVQTARASVTGDSAAVAIQRGDSTRNLRIGTSARAIYAPYSHIAVLQLLADRARAVGRDTVDVPLITGFGQQTAGTARVTRLGRDSLLFSMPFIEYRASVSPAGRITGLSAPGSTNKITARRLASSDIMPFAREWTARDTRGAGFGMASPRDTARGTLPGGHVMVDYGRPAKRGRSVWGGELVPVDSVWRTGANEAARLTTDRDILIGGVTVPAGTYTLRTIVSRSGPWKLVINKQLTDPRNPSRPLWGTEYDAAQDLARVDLQTRRLDQPVERFTITIEPQGQGGVLRMAWDTTEAFVPFVFR